MEGVAAPEEWLVSRLCEEFNCLPSAAVRELEEGIPGLAYDVMELRAYARAKAALDAAEKPEDVPTSPMVARVWAVMAEIHRRRRGAKGGRDAESRSGPTRPVTDCVAW